VWDAQAGVRVVSDVGCQFRLLFNLASTRLPYESGLICWDDRREMGWLLLPVSLFTLVVDCFGVSGVWCPSVSQTRMYLLS